MTVSCGRLSVEQRWFYQLFVSILVSVGNGAVFCFGIFSPFMKEPPFSYTQEDVTFVSTTGGVLSYLSLPTGYIFDHYGPRITLAIGGITSFIGWLGMYIVFREDENPLFGTSVGVISFFYGISLLSASFFETGSVLSNLEGLSLHQGRVVIIQKTFMGLGSSIISQIYIGFFQGSFPIASFFLFLALFNLIIGMYGAYVIELPNPNSLVVGLNCLPEAEEDVPREGKSSRSKREGEDLMDDSLKLLPTPQRSETSPADHDEIPSSTVKPSMALPLRGTTRTSSTDAALAVACSNRLYTTAFDRPFRFGIFVLFLVIGFITAVTIAEDYVDFSASNRAIIGSVTIVLLVSFIGMVALTPIGVGVKETPPASPPREADEATGISLEPQRGVASARRNDLLGSSVTVVYGSVPTADDVDAAEPAARQPEEVAPRRSGVEPFRMSRSIVGHNGAVWFLNDAPLTKNMFTIEMMLMWVVSFGVWGTTTVITGNSSQIYQSLDYDNYKETTNAVYVSMYGVASALGRVAVGALQPYLVGRRRHIVSLFPIAPLINIVALPLFFMVPSTLLIVPFFLAGLATGCTWGSTVLIIKALFHHSNCGKHYNVLYTAGMLTPIVMNIALFGPVYDSHSRAQGLDTTHSCRGAECVLTPLMVSLALNVVAFCAAYVFYRRVSEKGGI